jgi:hypothetical protein
MYDSGPVVDKLKEAIAEQQCGNVISSMYRYMEPYISIRKTIQVMADIVAALRIAAIPATTATTQAISDRYG